MINIDGIYDVNKEKFNLFTPGSNIKIIPENQLKKIKMIIFYFNMHFRKSILRNFKNIILKIQSIFGHFHYKNIKENLNDQE